MCTSAFSGDPSGAACVRNKAPDRALPDRKIFCFTESKLKLEARKKDMYKVKQKINLLFFSPFYH